MDGYIDNYTVDIIFTFVKAFYIFLSLHDSIFFFIIKLEYSNDTLNFVNLYQGER